MNDSPELTLHVLPPSHPSRAAIKALELKGLEFERVDLEAGKHVEEMQKLYGEGKTTVPGLMVGEEPVHGSRQIMARLEELQPDPPLYPEGMADQVREAERWGDQEFQDLGRSLTWGALHFRPEAMGTLGGGGRLDPAGTDFAIRYVRASWKYHGITCESLATDLAGLPEKLDRIDAFADEGIIGTEQPNAADLQIGATARVLLLVEDLKPLLEGRPSEEIGMRHFPDYQGSIPAGAFPEGWIPERSA